MIMHIVHFFGSSKVSILYKVSENTIFNFIVVLDCFSKKFAFRPLEFPFKLKFIEKVFS